MKTITDKEFWRKLTKKEILHLLIDAGVENLTKLNNTFAFHQRRRNENPEPAVEPCWECKEIARKLGAIE